MAAHLDNHDDSDPLPEGLIDLVDKAVKSDFIVMEITDEDRENPYYKSMRSMLEDFYNTRILYERKVIASSFILPRLQFLFGFKHKEGMCLVLEKPWHKLVACGDDLDVLNQNCFLVNRLQFLLQEVESDKRWCYVPLCLCEHSKECELTKRANSLRLSLWVGPKAM
ncbi:MAG: hypothetical protein JW839_04495 [Candidatus Lokiarchaeota archaeon]|nr:hypothetical protein [Candidatus Lokiarchaeota archaeon]